MRLLELYAGTGSVGKVAREKGWEVISLDLKGADINMDIMEWDYKVYPEGHFDVVWGSPPCTEYSKAKSRGMRNIEYANTIVERTLEIINYYNPKYWFIENPQTGKLKEQSFMEYLPYHDVDYCMYGMPYRKRTRIWCNHYDFNPKLCDKNCGSFIDGKHIGSCGNGQKKYTDKHYKLTEKYIIPPLLIKDLLDV